MISHLFGILRFGGKKSSEKVVAFNEALKWVETYIKTEEYETAIMATRELMLKVKSGITYYLDAEKKVTTLATSNIEEIAKKAKEKAKFIDKETKQLYQLELKLIKLIERIEVLKGKRDQVLANKKEELEIEKDIHDIDEHIKRKEYAQALHIAKRLASTYFNSKKTIDVLTKTQKLYDKYKHKEDIAVKDDEKKKRYFREIGVSKEVVQKGGGRTEKTWVHYISHLRKTYLDYKIKEEEKLEYIKKKKSLRNIENALLRLGSISNVTEEVAQLDIEKIMESGLTKDIGNFGIDGYEFFGKIIGKDKIVGDTFGSYRDGSRTVFYFGDATGHGVQAGFTVSLLTKIFGEQSKKIRDFGELFTVVNNELKEKLKGRVFVTAVFFEHDSATGKLRYIGAGHDPMFMFFAKNKMVEKIIPGGLALGVRRIANISSLKIREMNMFDGDVLLGYTDGIIEARNVKSELFGLERIQTTFDRVVNDSKGSILRIFQLIMEDVSIFMGNQSFQDDVSVFIFKRNPKLDVVLDKDELDKLLKEHDINSRTIVMNLRGKTRAEIQEEIRKERKNKELEALLINMLQLYKIGEYPRLKQAVTQAYKMGYVHEKMAFYLEKILKNEDKMKILKHEDRLQKKFEMLSELCDKGEYGIVIRETVDVLYKNGNI